MATFTSSVSYSIDGNTIDLADNDFRMIEQNGILNQWSLIDLTDLYPSANFTFGFELTATEDPSSTVIPFILSFYDTETRLRFNFNTNATETAFSVVMENTVNDTLQTYTLYTGTKPSYYPATDTKILIRILNGFLWVKVGSTFWLEKYDIEGHPLHLEGGIIQFSLTNTSVLVSHRIKNIYLEPILNIADQTYFQKSIFCERIEGLDIGDVEPFTYLGSNVGLSNVNPQFTLDVGGNINAYEYYKNGQIYSLNPDDLIVDYPVGLLLCDYHGNTYNNDPDWKKCGETVNRADYKRLANEIGIPVSQTTFKLPCPRIKQEWIQNPQWATNGSNIYYTAGSVGIGTSLMEGVELVVNGKIRGQRGIHIGEDVVSSQLVGGGIFENLLCSLELNNTNHLNVDDCALLVGNASINHNKIGISIAIGGGAYGLVCIKNELSKYRFALLDDYFPRPNDVAQTVETMSVLSSLDGGFVGIGTTNPSQKLEVMGYTKQDGLYVNQSLFLPTPLSGFIGRSAESFVGGTSETESGIIPTIAYNITTNPKSLLNVDTAQPVFNFNPILRSNTLYQFKIFIPKARNAPGGTGVAHTLLFGFQGTATTTYRYMSIVSRHSTYPPITTPNICYGSTGETQVGASYTGVGEYTAMTIEGNVRVFISGTFIPYIRYSVVPVSGATGGYTDVVQANASYSFNPIATRLANTIGGEWTAS